MKFKTNILIFVVALAMILSVFTIASFAAAGDNLWISESAWGQLADPAGEAVYPKGDQITIPVTITSNQGTILVTTPGSGGEDEAQSMPERDMMTGLYTNVVYIDTVAAPAAGSVYTYTFGFEPALVFKGQKLYVKVGGTDLVAGDHQKAVTTYLGAARPEGDYTAAVDSSQNLVITTPSTALAVPPSTSWLNPKVVLTICDGNVQREVTDGITTTDTAITVPYSSIADALSDLSLSEIIVTGILINDSAIENTVLGNQALTVTLGAFGPAYGDVSSDGVIDISDVIMAAEIAVGYTGYTDEQKARANVSSKTDPAVDISDVILIAERAVGGIDAFPVEKTE